MIVLVTEPEYRRAAAVFDASHSPCLAVPPDEGALVAAIAQHHSRFVIVGSTRYTGALFEALGPLGVVARFGVGHDNIDKEKATRAGVLCTNTPGVLDQSVAEHAILLMLAAARRLPALTAEMKNGQWALGPEGAELRGRTLAVIGAGRIGQATARIATAGFGMRAVGYRRTSPADSAPFETVSSDFQAAVRGADFVSLHINAEPANEQFISREKLAMMPAHAWLINTARGAVVDERALFDSLSGGRLAGAALDVFAREPYVPTDPTHDLRSLRNVIMTPHVGSNTAEANRAMAMRALQNISLAEGNDFARMDLLNPEVLR